MLKKILSIKEIVKDILVKHPETRDNDRLLMLKVWAAQQPRLRDCSFSFIEFAEVFLRGQYADSESIRRTRQKLQELNPELRGKYYVERSALMNEMRQQMPNINM